LDNNNNENQRSISSLFAALRFMYLDDWRYDVRVFKNNILKAFDLPFG
jgi:hypothetical protein